MDLFFRFFTLASSQCARRGFRVFGNKPNDAHHRRAAIGRKQHAFNHKIPSEGRWHDFNHFMLARVIQQSRGEFFPRFNGETETAKKFRLVLPVAMRSRKQVMSYFSAWDNRAFGIGQFHALRLRVFALKNLFSYLRTFPLRAEPA